MDAAAIFWHYGGALCFGLVVGWITYRTLRYTKANGVSDIASVIAALGGAGVTAAIGKETPGFNPFNPYCVGLALGFFGYLVTAVKKPDIPWLGATPHVVVNADSVDPTSVSPVGSPVNR